MPKMDVTTTDLPEPRVGPNEDEWFWGFCDKEFEEEQE